MARRKKEQVKSQLANSFFEKCTVCKIRREDNLTCINCVNFEECKENKNDIVYRLNDTLIGFKPRQPQNGIYI